MCPQLPRFQGPTPALCAPPGLCHAGSHQGSSSPDSPPPGSSRAPCVSAENPRPAAPPGTAHPRPAAKPGLPGLWCEIFPLPCSWARLGKRWPCWGLAVGKDEPASQRGAWPPPALHAEPRSPAAGLEGRALCGHGQGRACTGPALREGLGARVAAASPTPPETSCAAQLPVTIPSLTVLPVAPQGWARAVSPPRCM